MSDLEAEVSELDTKTSLDLIEQMIGDLNNATDSQLSVIIRYLETVSLRKIKKMTGESLTILDYVNRQKVLDSFDIHRKETAVAFYKDRSIEKGK